MAAKTPKSQKDTKVNEVSDWLRWAMAERWLAKDQCGTKCATPRRYSTELSLFTETQMKKTHACQIYFHRSNFDLMANP